MQLYGIVDVAPGTAGVERPASSIQSALVSNIPGCSESKEREGDLGFVFRDEGIKKRNISDKFSPSFCPYGMVELKQQRDL